MMSSRVPRTPSFNVGLRSPLERYYGDVQYFLHPKGGPKTRKHTIDHYAQLANIEEGGSGDGCHRLHLRQHRSNTIFIDMCNISSTHRRLKRSSLYP